MCNLGEIKGHTTKWWLFHLPHQRGWHRHTYTSVSKTKSRPFFILCVFFFNLLFTLFVTVHQHQRPRSVVASGVRAWQNDVWESSELWCGASARLLLTSLAFHTHLSVYPFSRMAKYWNLWMNTALLHSFHSVNLEWWHLDHTSSLKLGMVSMWSLSYGNIGCTNHNLYLFEWISYKMIGVNTDWLE